MRIALDVDGVLYHWSKTARYLLKAEFGYNLHESTYWSYIPDNVSKQAWDWLWSEGIRRGLFRHGHVVKGAVDGAWKLKRAGHELLAVTHRPVSAVIDTHDWLDFHFGRTFFEQRHILYDGRSKSCVRADLLVDDKFQNVQEWMWHVDREAILYSQLWNDHEPWFGWRGTWETIPSLVRELT